MLRFYALLACLLPLHFLMAQDQNLEINCHCENLNSPFSNVRAIDNRIENQLLGYIQTGLGNRVRAIRFNGSIADTLAHFFVSKSPEVGPSMVFMLNELFLHEVESAGRLKLSLRLFRETGDGKFVEFLTVDSVYRPKGFDVTKKLLRQVNEQFCEIAKRAVEVKLDSNSDQRAYSLNELAVLDSLEKLSIPMYVASKPHAGIYKDYQHFKMNTPDISTEMLIDTSKAKNIKVFRIFKAKNRKVKLDNQGIYAVSDGNILIKVTSAGDYCIMTKENSDFYYERTGSFASQPNNAMMPLMYGGAVGGAIGAMIIIAADGSISYGPKIERYRFRINHRRGNSIPLMVVQKAPRVSRSIKESDSNADETN